MTLKTGQTLILIGGILAILNGIYLILGGAFGASGSFATVLNVGTLGIFHIISGAVLLFSWILTRKRQYQKSGSILALVFAFLFKFIETLATGFLWFLPLIGGILVIFDKSKSEK